MRLKIWNLHIASDHLHLERQWIEVYRRCDSILSLLGTETLFSSNQANHSTQRLQQFLLGCDKSHANLFIHLVGVLHCTQNISLIWWRSVLVRANQAVHDAVRKSNEQQILHQDLTHISSPLKHKHVDVTAPVLEF